MIRLDNRFVYKDKSKYYLTDITKVSEWRKMSDSEKEAYDYKQKVKRLEEENIRLMEERKEQERQKNNQILVEQYARDRADAIKKNNLPDSDYIRNKMLDYVLAAQKNGYSITFDDAAKQLIQDENKLKSVNYKDLSDEELERVIGEDTVKRIRQSHV